MPRCFHTTTSSASITFITSSTFVTSDTLLTSGTGTYAAPGVSAWVVAGGGCQRDGAGTECGFAIERRPLRGQGARKGLQLHSSLNGGSDGHGGMDELLVPPPAPLDRDTPP